MHVFETAIGTCSVTWSDAGLTGVSIRCGRPVTPGHGPAVVASIVSLLAGEPTDLTGVTLDMSGLDDFRRTVYAATRRIGPGAIATYGEIARAVGDPGAARAVGAALGSNPFPIVVPCHRILAADGSLHGFSAPGGIATKRRMLEIERAPGFTQQSLFALS